MTTFFASAAILATVLAASGVAQAVTVEEVTSPGGIKAYLAQDHTNPIIGISFMFQGGAALDADSKLGLSSMVTALLDEGAGDKDSLAFHSELEDRAISLGFSADRDAVRGSVSTTTQASAVAFDLLNLAMTQPRFDTEPTERVRRQLQVRLKSESENPNRIASRTLMAALFVGHPYGRLESGTPETVAAITTDDLRQWVKTRLAKDRLIVAAVGDITPSQLGQALDKIFGSLPATTKLVTSLPDARVSNKAQEIKVEKALPQSVISIAQPGIKRTDPDWYVAQVLDYTFGGGSFASRLMNEVREKRGLAYGVSSSMQAFDAAGLVMVGAGTRSDQAQQSLDVIRAEFKKIQKDGLTEAELNDAKQYLTGAWPLRFSSTGRIADTLVAVQKDKLGLDYLDKRNSFINAVTLADTKRVAAKLYQPDALTVVVVGPGTKAKEAPVAPGKRPERERKS
jgi:zinc protease